jgi:putative colanic acid biosynthesis glycosyltransferase
MKILTINTELNRGGAAQIAHTLYQSLNEKEKISCYFVYGKGMGSEDKNSYKFGYWPEIYFHWILTRYTGLQGYGSWFSTKKLEKIIIEEKFDLIHLHNLHGYYLNLSFINFLKKTNIPIIWTLHDGWSITGRCAYCFNCTRWKTGCGKCPDLSLYPKTFIDSSNFMWKKKKKYFSSGWNPILVCPSQWLADIVKESYLKEFSVKIIANAVNTKVFKPKDKNTVREKYGIPSEKKIVLILAADLEDERKGVKYFFESLNYIQVKDGMVITVGEKINYDKIKGLEFEIKQMGYIKDQDELSNIYNLADVFCISSLNDNFPNTVIEAMACGIPVVGFKVGGISEQVTENCGILVTLKDTKTLGKAIEKLLKEETIRKNFSLNCRERALQKYNINVFGNNYINLYKDILNR